MRDRTKILLWLAFLLGFALFRDLGLKRFYTKFESEFEKTQKALR